MTNDTDRDSDTTDSSTDDPREKEPEKEFRTPFVRRLHEADPDRQGGDGTPPLPNDTDTLRVRGGDAETESCVVEYDTDAGRDIHHDPSAINGASRINATIVGDGSVLIERERYGLLSYDDGDREFDWYVDDTFHVAPDELEQVAAMLACSPAGDVPSPYARDHEGAE